MKPTVHKTILLAVFLLVVCTSKSQQRDTTELMPTPAPVPYIASQEYTYSKPKPFSFITNLPKDVWGVAKSPFEKNGWKGFAVVAVSSAILIKYDQQLLDGVRTFSDNIHLHPETDDNTLINIKNGPNNIRILKIPKNLNSAFYTIGEGWIGAAIGVGFWIQGKIARNNRSLQTASDLMEGFMSTAVITQIIKRSTGRESPFLRTAPGGRWRPFPSFHEFQVNTSAYDGFPSGHLATLMTTITVLADNYPEKKWIKPVGYIVMGLSSFAMMNTEVHWAGDYPLAVAIGYLNGKIITGRHKKHTVSTPKL